MNKNIPNEKDHKKTKNTPNEMMDHAPRCRSGGRQIEDTFEHLVIERAFEALVSRLATLKICPKNRLDIFVVSPQRKVIRALPDPLVTGRLSAVLLGRHPRCDLRIDDDPDVSRRHALLVYRTFGHGGRCLAFDLDSSNGTFGFDHKRIRGAKLIPPFALRLGRSVVFGLTSNFPFYRASDFCSIPWNRRLGEPSFSTSPWDERPLGMLSARGPRGTAGVELDGDSLDRGVIVGTNPRSPVFEALESSENSVSEKHMVVFRHESRVHAVDLHSTNGSTYADCPIAVPVPLPSYGPSRLELGGHSYATWTPYVSPPLLGH